jgi:parvulin-like peptidyl-prolyl isomerase
MSSNRVTVRPAAAATILVGIVCAFAAGGCLFNRETPQPLTSDAFVAQRVEGRADPQPIDRPGQVIVEGVNPPAVQKAPPPGRGAPRSPNEISPAVRQSVREPGENGNGASSRPARPATARSVAAARSQGRGPATARAAIDPSGQYVIFGTVLAQVSSRPIYAHRVLAVLDNALRAEAQRYDDPRAFKPVAAKLIADEIRNQVRDELVFAVAEKSLDAREKQLADMFTAKWQKEEETKAGGSLELAKRRWADEGWDFNERLDYQYRVAMTRVFYQRRVFPLVNVTASDIRRYYEANKDTEFTRPARAKFRVIKIDPRQLKLPGGADQAKTTIRDIRAKAVKGNFEALARELNDPILKASGGLVPGNDQGWLPKGTYVAERVEDAVWALQPGQVTNVIEEKGAFYIAKLEDRQEAVSQEFEDLAVQQQIDEKLQAQQFKELQEQRQNKFMKDAVVWEHPQMMQVAVDMAMQRFAGWKSAGADASK